MLIEFYGVPGAMALGDRYSEEFLSLLVRQTAELRRDPDKRERETAQKSLEAFLAKHQGEVIQTKTKDGQPIEIDLTAFQPV